ncbi:hypothetical protein [Agitococcus lubricus]|uniref:hypothetical protein n=1 Tax=Agitococcus lubricus TaxID=1077255 RepID=UPI0011B292E7|nr:hypothetical protein [Agitococcus lubricus]
MTDYKNHLLKFINNFIELPKNPKQAANLITRARALLGRRKNEEIESLDNSITFVIDDFSKLLKQEHGGNYKRYMATALNIHTDIDLLKHCLNEYNFSYTDNNLSKVTMSDYFAVYGVRHVAIAHLVVTSQPPQGLSDKDRASFRFEQTQQAHDFMFTALECISYAEQLKTTENLILKNEFLELENNQLKQNQQVEIKKQAKREISKKASDAAKKSHYKDYQEKEKVINWLSQYGYKDNFIYRTNNKIAEELFRLDIFNISFNTLLKYISEYKKEHLKPSKTA